MTEKQNKIADRADEIQKALHKIIEMGKKSKGKAEYQDYVTAYLISKIASLEIELESRK